MAAAVTARRTTAAHPLAAMDAARAAASRKARLTPEELTEEEAMLIPPRLLLELGNQGRLQHLGLGLPLKPSTPARTPRITASKSARAQLTDDDLARMSGTDISKAMAAGQVAGIGRRRTGRRH
jgi:hypothetical protein